MKNCLICVLDSLRYDAVDRQFDRGLLSELGLQQKIQTSQLDRLKKAGVMTRRMISPWPGTAASLATILTGLYPREHGAFASANGRPMDPSTVGLEKLFKRAGYRTVFWTDFPKLKPVLQADSRFDECGQGPLKNLIERIKRLNHQGKPVFVLMHTDDTHGTYMMSNFPPTADYHDRAIAWANRLARLCELDYSWGRDDAQGVCQMPGISWESNRYYPVWKFHRELQVKTPDWLERIEPVRLFKLLVTMYIEGINHYDSYQLAELRRFLLTDEIGKNTVTVITSDHGQTLRRREGSRIPTFYHAGKPVEDLVHVPSIWLNSSLEQSDLDRWKISSSVDIAPTLSGLFDLSDPPAFSGNDLRHPPPAEYYVYTESSTISDLRDEFPRFCLVNWNAIISSRGYKYYRQLPALDENDLAAPVDQFIWRVFYKIRGETYRLEQLQPVVNKFLKNDSLARRVAFVRQMLETDPPERELYNWRQDYSESENLLSSISPTTAVLAQKLDRRLNQRFPNSFDCQEFPFAQPVEAGSSVG